MDESMDNPGKGAPHCATQSAWDPAELRTVLDEADISVLVLVYVHLTGDETVLNEAAPYIRPWDDGTEFPPEFAQRVRELLMPLLLAQKSAPDIAPSIQLLHKMMSVGVGEDVPEEYVEMMLEQGGLKPSILASDFWTNSTLAAQKKGDFHVVIIGAGLSGICAAIQLRHLGIPFTIFEKNSSIGGVWWENVYPGCAVDTPNHYYSFSFEPKPDWSNYFSKRDEIHAYFEKCIDKYDVRKAIRFNTTCKSVRYVDSDAKWEIVFEDKQTDSEQVVRSNCVIFAVGQLNRPFIPSIKGIDTFAGPVVHTAQWPKDLNVKGLRVGMIGTGSSGMQVGPTIAPEVDRLVVLQRSPHWAVKSTNYHRAVEPGKKVALQRIPYYSNWYRFQLFWWSSDRWHPLLQVDPEWPFKDRSTNAKSEEFRQQLIEYMRSEVDDDPVLMEKIVPPYPPFGKRMVRDNNWYRMLKRPNVELVTAPIERITPTGVEMADGTRHELDALVLATGFRASEHLMPIDVRGRHGRTIQEVWKEEGPRAYLGVTAPGFPNMFMIFGPNTVIAHGGSGIFHTECAVRYIAQCLVRLIEGGSSSMECRQDVHDEYNSRVDDAHSRLLWTYPTVTNWFRHPNGRVTQATPWRQVDYWKLTSDMNPLDFLWRKPEKIVDKDARRHELEADR